MHKQSDATEGNSEAMEIDLKCAEKVTDSDVESTNDDKVGSVLWTFRLKIFINCLVNSTERSISKGSNLLLHWGCNEEAKANQSHASD